MEIPIIKEEVEIKHKEIAELQEPMLKIFKEILPNIESRRNLTDKKGKLQN